MPPSKHDDGSRKDVAASKGAVARTVGTVRPDEGRSNPTPQPDTNAFRQAAWIRLWDQLLREPDDLAA